jgi:hypothetical protein
VAAETSAKINKSSIKIETTHKTRRAALCRHNRALALPGGGGALRSSMAASRNIINRKRNINAMASMAAKA